MGENKSQPQSRHKKNDDDDNDDDEMMNIKVHEGSLGPYIPFGMQFP